VELIPESGWTYQNILKFDFEVEDTNALYDLYLEVDYNTSFPYQNIYVNVFTGMSEDKMNKTQLSLDLSNNLGIWKGDCNAEKCTYLLPLQKSIYFEKPGRQYFWIEQFSRSENINGIKSIRFVGDIIGTKNQ
jgi:gliding motility-associated lipoprotein GldH